MYHKWLSRQVKYSRYCSSVSRITETLDSCSSTLQSKILNDPNLTSDTLSSSLWKLFENRNFLEVLNTLSILPESHRLRTSSTLLCGMAACYGIRQPKKVRLH